MAIGVAEKARQHIVAIGARQGGGRITSCVTGGIIGVGRRDDAEIHGVDDINGASGRDDG